MQSMDRIKVIHQVNDNTFELKEIEYFWSSEIAAKKAELGITYDDVTHTGWATTEYPAGRFIIKWHTNFNYGKQTFVKAYIFYVNPTKGTKTFIDFIENVPNLETIASLMNKYANINQEQLWELFDNAVNRLGLYHRLHRQQRDNTMDTGYDYTTFDTLDSGDFDRKCLQHVKDAQDVAVTLQRNIRYLYRMTAGIKAIDDLMIKRIIDKLQSLDKEYNVSDKPIFWNGRLGQEHTIGDFSLMVDYSKEIAKD
jgi:hypothetical protein